jgi:DNA-binding winged helix-turn-helix (wHTH) protein
LLAIYPICERRRGESSGSGKYIETVPKRGYRFVGKVKELTGTTLIVQRHTRSSVVVEEEIEADSGVRSIAVLPFKLVERR